MLTPNSNELIYLPSRVQRPGGPTLLGFHVHCRRIFPKRKSMSHKPIYQYKHTQMEFKLNPSNRLTASFLVSLLFPFPVFFLAQWFLNSLFPEYFFLPYLLPLYFPHAWFCGKSYFYIVFHSSFYAPFFGNQGTSRNYSIT